jgi:glutamate synthase domain-containing protein 2
MSLFGSNSDFFLNASQLLSSLFILLIGTLFAMAVVFYIIDVFQTRHTIRRNYPLLGRFRYLFENLGEFFRQYFYSQDREELPFNRAQRSWVYRAAKNLDNTQAFGSTRQHGPGTIVFVNAPFPILGEEATDIEPVIFGPFSRHPYHCKSLFNISGMSYGAISKPAVQALSRGANQAGCWLNTGEGGLSPFHLEGGCDLVFQIGTAKYGVRDELGRFSEQRLASLGAIENIKMFEIKLSQGAKPGKGGLLPGAKVTPEIANIRGIPEGQDSISPNRHPDISRNEELLDKIAYVREVTGKPVGIKTVLGDSAWLDELLSLIKIRGIETAPDFITLDSADGGTGAAPMTLIDDMGLNLHETLPTLVDKLIEHDLKKRIVVIASGKMINPTDVAWALCVGADVAVSARGFMFSLGCIQALQCNKNTCPTGITTHDPKLQRGLVAKDKAERVANYQRNMIKELQIIAHSCGVPNPRYLKRQHARQVISHCASVRLDQLYASRYQSFQQ